MLPTHQQMTRRPTSSVITTQWRCANTEQFQKVYYGNSSLTGNYLAFYGANKLHTCNWNKSRAGGRAGDVGYKRRRWQTRRWMSRASRAQSITSATPACRTHVVADSRPRPTRRRRILNKDLIGRQFGWPAAPATFFVKHAAAATTKT